MGRRNTSSKSICGSLYGQNRSRALIQTEQLPCLVLIEYSWTDRFPGEALSGQLIRGRCIDQLSWHDLSDGMRRPVSTGCVTLPMIDVLLSTRKGDRL